MEPDFVESISKLNEQGEKMYDREYMKPFLNKSGKLKPITKIFSKKSDKCGPEFRGFYKDNAEKSAGGERSKKFKFNIKTNEEHKIEGYMEDIKKEQKILDELKKKGYDP